MQHFDVVVVGEDPSSAMTAAAALKKVPSASVAIMDTGHDRRSPVAAALLNGPIMLLQPAEERK